MKTDTFPGYLLAFVETTTSVWRSHFTFMVCIAKLSSMVVNSTLTDKIQVEIDVIVLAKPKEAKCMLHSKECC